MDEITLKNYRCFRDEQTARLAPLTLLVGENSTGKTSFLAMIRALWDAANQERAPDFKEDPYDLGSFDELAHHRGAKGGRAETFEAAFHRTQHGDSNNQPYRFGVAFAKKGTAPVPVKKRLARGGVWIEVCHDRDLPPLIKFGTAKGGWHWKIPDASRFRLYSDDDRMEIFFPAFSISEAVRSWKGDEELIPQQGSDSPTDNDLAAIKQLAQDLEYLGFYEFGYYAGRPYAGAPVRSKPRRTYDPSRATPDPEGDYVPMYLANLFFQEKRAWNALKGALESFGRAAGLFDEISIKPLGRRDSEPFQVQVRKFGGRLKGPRRNLIDMGYGVSQVLPVITELLRSDAPPLFLLQQPEVHLHPSAQAALGSLFCQVASWNRQLIIETHSDHLLDRVRMDVRDGATRLKPEDISILFFERGDLDVRIHSLRLDEEGNVLDAPESYRRFFMEETARSLWKRQRSVRV